jgi:L-lactate dehydrogenase complex protein LldG
MSEARHRILQRLRRVERPSGDEELTRSVDRHPWNRDEKIERFSTRMSEVRAEVHLTTKDTWAADLTTILLNKGVRNMVYAPDKPDGSQLATALNSAKIDSVPYAQSIEAWKCELFQQMDAGFTSCRGAIAETGSLILWPDEAEPRLLSLVPPIHCVLLQADQIHSTFAEAIEAQGWTQEGMPTNALLISGPSKSADIAQVLAYGVHGPKSLVVMVVQ